MVRDNRSETLLRGCKVTTPQSRDKDSYLSDDEVASLLGLSVSRLRNKISAGHPLPPYILPIGCRKRLWPYQKVHDWLAGFLVTGDGSGVSNAGHGGTSRQGRSHRKSDFT